MENIKDLIIYGYKLTYNNKGFFKVYNSYNDHIASIYKQSKLIIVNRGCIFNYKNETQKAINANPNFLNI